MSSNNTIMQLPDYQEFLNSIAVLCLPISGSELHGVMCGYLAAGRAREGATYLRALMQNKPEEAARMAARSLFGIYTISQQQITQFEFDFQLLLPGDEETLGVRARAFSEWCEGFTQGITIAGIDLNQLDNDETEEIIAHMTEFANLDCDALVVSEDDERALMEVIEYARMATLHIYSDVQANELGHDGAETAH